MATWAEPTFLAGGMVSYAFGSVIASLTVKVPVYQHFIEVAHG